MLRVRRRVESPAEAASSSKSTPEQRQATMEELQKRQEAAAKGNFVYSDPKRARFNGVRSPKRVEKLKRQLRAQQKLKCLR